MDLPVLDDACRDALERAAKIKILAPKSTAIQVLTQVGFPLEVARNKAMLMRFSRALKAVRKEKEQTQPPKQIFIHQISDSDDFTALTTPSVLLTSSESLALNQRKKIIPEPLASHVISLPSSKISKAAIHGARCSKKEETTEQVLLTKG